MKKSPTLAIAPKPVIATTPPKGLSFPHLFNKPETVWRADVAGDQQEFLRTNALIATIRKIGLGFCRLAFFGRIAV